ncbi:MAG: 30S ribosomal protein S17 [Candidatus Helarchaeota archaeon]
MKRNIGIDVVGPKKECDDIKCPFHGKLSIRGRIFEGKVISTRMKNTVVVRRDYLYYLKKYKRYEKRHNNITAHCPPCFDEIKEGDIVKIAECRPLSKTKSYVVVEIKSRE